MTFKFKKLLSFLLLLPLLTASGTSSDLPSHPSQSPSANQKPEDTICHGLTCYPRVFVPTHEFQVIRDDQEVPQGLHYRINIETGVREAKINVPGEGEDIESATIQLPPEGGRGDVVFIGEENEKKEEKPKPNIKLKGSKGDEDGHGAIKPPPTLKSEQLTFTDSVNIILAGERKHTPEQIITALNSLENLVHEIYWGLKISVPENISSLLQLISTSSNATIRSAAALVIGSALQNNPKALASADGIQSFSGKSINNKAITNSKLIPTLLTCLTTESNPQALCRILYALNHSIKSPKTLSEFHSHNGLSTLHSLFQSTTSDNGEFKAKCSTFIEDNFLNPDFQNDLDKYGKPIHTADSRVQKVLGRVGKQTDQLLLAFCQPLQNSLIDSERYGIFDDDIKSKILSALVTLRKKIGTCKKHGCPASDDFLTWFQTQADTKGKSIEQLEDAGEWFKLKVIEFHQEGSFDADKQKKTKCKGCWF